MVFNGSVNAGPVENAPQAGLRSKIMKMMQRLAVGAAVLLATAYASAEPHNPNTDWFSQAGWGVFVHYLWDVQNVGNRANTMGKPPVSWDECVKEFDTEKFADQIQQTGAPYVFFTMMQRTRYLIAPNATYDKLTGYQPGEACSKRDLVEDLYRSLNKRGIKLMLYWTGDGPRQDAQAANGMGGWNGNVTDEYVQNWADVVAEYSRRYGDKVNGWWVDGCYAHIGYNDKRWGILAAGLKTGNPKAIVALNNPSMSHANSGTDHEDFTTGEVNAFTDIPDERWRDGKQFHVLSFLGPDWGTPGLRYNADYLTDYVGAVDDAGGVVTIDVALFRDGSIDAKQQATLKAMSAALKQRGVNREPWKTRAAIPAGNLACWKPAKLLSLDGQRILPANGGGGSLHSARYGVDGNLATTAQPGGEWPWTYEVNLVESAPVGRVAITFGKNYATHFQVQLSADRQTWTTVAEVKDHDGSKWEQTFAAVSAQYVRVRALQPAGPGQKGGQMSVAELDVYAADGTAAPKPARFIQKLRAGQKQTIVTLGTSLTGGTWRWVNVMKEWLDADFPRQVTVHNLGVGASASSHPPGQGGLDTVKQCAGLKPDVVFIEFAVNDSYLPYNISLADSKRNLNLMVDAVLKANPDAEIVVQTTNPVMDMPDAQNRHATNRPKLADYCEGYREVARQRGLILIDNYPNWLNLLNSSRDEFLKRVPDGIHPREPGYREVVLPELRRVLLGKDEQPEY